MLEDREVYELARGIEAHHHGDQSTEALEGVALYSEADELTSLLGRIHGKGVGLTLGEEAQALGEGVIIKLRCHGTDCLDFGLDLSLLDGGFCHLIDQGEDTGDDDADPR